jgi:hypothetical protein
MPDFLKARLQHAFDVTVFFGKERAVFGPLPGGASQGYTPPIKGVIEGPMLNGTVVPRSGADYATVRPDGVIELNAHYLLKADDGTLIYIQNTGYLVRAPEGKGKPNEQGVPQPAYFKFTPKFRVPEGPHDWLARTVIVGSGERRTDPDHSVFRYYAVR